MSKPIEIDLTNQGVRAPAFGTALSSADADQAASRLAPDGLQSTGAYPPGALRSKEELIAAVTANGRQKKTPVYVTGIDHFGRRWTATYELIAPLKITRPYNIGEFFDDVRGWGHSFRDWHMEPQSYNQNYAFLDPEAAAAYNPTAKGQQS